MSRTARRFPTFVIAGAPQAGTTSLYHYLRQHPQVYMCPVKEPTYFGAAEFFAAQRDARREGRAPPARPWLEPLLRRAPQPLTWDEYLELFRGARDQIAVGEASVRYLVLPAAPRAIHARLPAARLIFVLRDPAEALLSRYVRTFGRLRSGSFARTFRAAQDSGHWWGQAVAVGRYATHLQRFYDVFPREQIRVYLYDDYRADGRAVVRDMLAAVGVDPDIPIDVSRRHNEGFEPRLGLVERTRRRVLGGMSLVRWLPARAYRTLRRLYYRPRPDVALDPADRALVIRYYRDEIRRTAELIGRDLSAWLR